MIFFTLHLEAVQFATSLPGGKSFEIVFSHLKIQLNLRHIRFRLLQSTDCLYQDLYTTLKQIIGKIDNSRY